MQSTYRRDIMSYEVFEVLQHLAQMRTPVIMTMIDPWPNPAVNRTETGAAYAFSGSAVTCVRRHLRALLPMLAVANAMLGCEGPTESVAADHPVIGAWKISSKDGLCVETYRFGLDNIAIITSGNEVAEVRSKLSATRDQEGFYRWDHTIVKHNGQKDCAGKVMKVGDSDTWFIQLSPAGDRLVFCQKPSTAACFGPLQRVS